jgi:hypothetical protein
MKIFDFDEFFQIKTKQARSIERPEQNIYIIITTTIFRRMASQHFSPLNAPTNGHQL